MNKKPKNQKAKKYSITLTPSGIRHLSEESERLGVLNLRGTKSGKPGWRALVGAISRGEILLSKPKKKPRAQ